MRIIFVRHGHPDYKHDCLTELGHKHAEAVAERLREEHIERICASSCGRAAQTAEHIARLQNKEVETFDFMREIGWGTAEGEEIPHRGHPWSLAEDMIADARTLMSSTWFAEDPFAHNTVTKNVRKVGENFDLWLADMGYVREGEYYRVTEPRYQTVAMVSHGGSSSAAIAHLFNLSFPFFCGTVHPDFTAITIVSFEGEEGALITPRIEIMNDCRHIAGIDTPPKKTHK